MQSVYKSKQMIKMKKKYTIDLAAQMAECEANYARLKQLLPEMATVDRREFGVEQVNGEPIELRLDVIERCKYTTMIEISQQLSPLKSSLKPPSRPPSQPWAPALCFSLRVYHDARMAEVIAYNRQQPRLASYEYPNNNMYQRDEKSQLNRYLGEWLSYCLKHGYVLDDPAAEQLYSIK